MVRRQRVAPTEEWQQIELLVRTPEQRTYEVLRPVVLFGQPVPARAGETGLPQSTLYRQAAAFERDGMASLFPSAPPERHRQLVPEIRQAILDLKREYPALNTHEITTICWARFGHRPSSRTVKRLLAEHPSSPRGERRYPLYHAFGDPAAARLALVRLHLEGWNVKSIAGYLECSRDTAHRVLKRWVTEGVAGLDDKSHARKDGARRVDLKTLLAVKELQRNPELGEWRVHAALRQQGLDLSPRTCGRILALNRALYGLPKPARVPKAPKPMPFQAARRHQIWTVDIRYLDAPQIAGRAYSITILDNFSRAVVASLLNWRVYGERGLAGEQAAVWLYEQTLTIAFGDEALAQYHVTYQPDRRHLGTVGEPRLYETPHRSAQPYLWALGDGEWLPVLRLPAYAARKPRVAPARQQPLFPLASVRTEEA